MLIIRLSAMGDVAMTVPVVYAFAKANPDIKISFLSKPFFEPIVSSIPNLEFVAANVTSEHKGVMGIWKLARQLKKRGITHVADLHNVIRSKMLCTFLNLPSATLDKGRAQKKALTRESDKSFTQLPTTIERYTAVFNKLGFKDIHPEVIYKPNSTPAVIEFTRGHSRKWLGVAPFAAHQGKQYPLDHMKKVLEGIDQVDKYDIFLFGAPSEVTILNNLSDRCKNVKVVAGVLTFKEELNLISQLDGMLSMDSGNAHLAAMYGVPTITLWGVTHPYAGFAPFNQAQHCIVSDRKKYPKIPTSVYGNVVPEGYEDVMKTILAQQVIDKIAATI